MTPFTKSPAAGAAARPGRAGPEAVDRDRRRLLITAAMGLAAAGVAGLLPSGAAPAAGVPPATGDAIRPFRVDVPERDLIDLRRRVLVTRWPDRETVDDQSQGIPLAKIR